MVKPQVVSPANYLVIRERSRPIMARYGPFVTCEPGL